jgi:hypothetical protein
LSKHNIKIIPERLVKIEVKIRTGQVIVVVYVGVVVEGDVGAQVLHGL